METKNQLPASVQELIRDRIHSSEELEALLLVRTEPSRWWTDEDVAVALRTSRELARSGLSGLTRNALCVESVPGRGPTRYEPSQPALASAVEQLAELYVEQRLEVLVFLSRSAISRVRVDALRTFAEAFRISGKKNG